MIYNITMIQNMKLKKYEENEKKLFNGYLKLHNTNKKIFRKFLLSIMKT